MTVTRRLSNLEQKLLTLPEHLSSTFSFLYIFCRWLFVLLFFLFWLLYCLSLFLGSLFFFFVLGTYLYHYKAGIWHIWNSFNEKCVLFDLKAICITAIFISVRIHRLDMILRYDESMGRIFWLKQMEVKITYNVKWSKFSFHPRPLQYIALISSIFVRIIVHENG